VNVGTVSRVERDRVEPTLETTLRLCAGIDLALSDYVRAAAPGAFPRASRRLVWAGQDRPVLAAADVVAFVDLSERRWARAQRLFEGLLDRIQAVRPGIRRESRFSVRDVLTALRLDDRSGFPAGLMPYDYDLEYPPDADDTDALRLHRSGSLLTYHDVGLYLRRARLERFLTLAALETATGLSDSVLCRLERGSLENLKLTTLVLLDEQLGCRGELLALSWRAAELHAGLIQRGAKPDRGPRGEWNRLQFLTSRELVKVSRWLDRLSPDGSRWLDDLRAGMATARRRG
jgi:transcriptional regulator with XRE-family HTH domain